jgi:hypothetical protein
MKSREKVNAFSQIPENNEVSWSFLRETPLKRHLTSVLALILENIPLNAFLFWHGMRKDTTWMDIILYTGFYTCLLVQEYFSEQNPTRRNTW